MSKNILQGTELVHTVEVSICHKFPHNLYKFFQRLHIIVFQIFAKIIKIKKHNMVHKYYFS